MIFLVFARKSFPAERSRHFRPEIFSCLAFVAFPLGNRFLLGAHCISARKSFPAERLSRFRSEIFSCSALAAFPHGNLFLLSARRVSARKSFPARRSLRFRTEIISCSALDSFPQNWRNFLLIAFRLFHFFIVFLWFCIFFYGLENYALFTSVSERNFVSIANVQKNRQPLIALPKKLTKFLQNFRFPLPFWKKCTVFAPFHRAFFRFSYNILCRPSHKKTGSLATSRPAVLSRMICVYSLLPRLLNTSAPSFSSTTMWLSRLTVPARICFDRSLSR